jgi:hypothetical protein
MNTSDEQVAATNRSEGRNPMKTYPYYSTNPQDREVFHNHNDCPTGEQIPADDRANGTNEYSHCEQCEDLDY